MTLIHEQRISTQLIKLSFSRKKNIADRNEDKHPTRTELASRYPREFCLPLTDIFKTRRTKHSTSSLEKGYSLFLTRLLFRRMSANEIKNEINIFEIIRFVHFLVLISDF